MVCSSRPRLLFVTIPEGFRCAGGSVQSPAATPAGYGYGPGTGAARCNGDLCTAEKHLVKYCRRNVIFGLIRERITGLVRIKHFRGPLGIFKALCTGKGN